MGATYQLVCIQPKLQAYLAWWFVWPSWIPHPKDLSILGLFLWRKKLKIAIKNKNLCCSDVCVGKFNTNKCASSLYIYFKHILTFLPKKFHWWYISN
jgi:hypothetical protein